MPTGWRWSPEVLLLVPTVWGLVSLGSLSEPAPAQDAPTCLQTAQFLQVHHQTLVQEGCWVEVVTHARVCTVAALGR